MAQVDWEEAWRELALVMYEDRQVPEFLLRPTPDGFWMPVPTRRRQPAGWWNAVWASRVIGEVRRRAVVHFELEEDAALVDEQVRWAHRQLADMIVSVMFHRDPRRLRSYTRP